MEPLEIVERAKVCEDIFGTPPKDIAARYRDLCKAVHPDRHPAEPARAHRAFVKLTRLKDEAEHVIGGGSIVVVATRGKTYRVGDVLRAGDVCDVRACSYDEGGVETSALFKIARSGADDDLVENEAKVLGALVPGGGREEKFLRYLPRLVDSFRARFDGETRRVNVLASYGDHVSLEEVRAAHPSGLDYRDAVWMFKRMLVALGWVHRQGIVHGAILPPHVLVHPIAHGARLVDWCYAVATGEKVRARVKAWEKIYAPEIGRREPATPATDIFMAARTVSWLLDRHRPAPPELLGFLRTCQAPSPRRRPDDAWALHDDLDALLKKLVGPPKYRRLEMPARA